ncbi:hypothetical protein OAG63_00980 [Methylacidiphilales bacterium]|nr:hypothetical protein [Candidatus Methylacidiphilales bacterium]
MRRTDRARSNKRTVALALTWDGARWPLGKLPPKARAFLTGKSKISPPPTARELSRFFAEDEISEMRICWVPRLKGGKDVLTEPFAPPEGKRLGFAIVRITSLGDILGVIYRRSP